jgi:ADP-ribose pyrophosphatase
MNFESNKATIFITPRFEVVKESLTLNGNLKEFYYLLKPNAVAIIVEFKEKIGLVKINRHLIVENQFEIIGGRIEIDEDPLNAAKRELFEEVGIISENWSFITSVFPLPSITTEKVYIFLVTIDEYTKNTQLLQTDEGIIDFCFYSKKDVFEMIRNNQILNALDGYALYYYYLNMKNND